MKRYRILKKIAYISKNPRKLLNKIRNPRRTYSELRDHKKEFVWKYHFNKGTITLPYGPITFRIEPTNKCNFRCLCCPNGISALEESGYMDFDFYKNVVDQISKITPNAYTIVNVLNKVT